MMSERAPAGEVPRAPGGRAQRPPGEASAAPGGGGGLQAKLARAHFVSLISSDEQSLVFFRELPLLGLFLGLESYLSQLPLSEGLHERAPRLQSTRVCKKRHSNN